VRYLLAVVLLTMTALAPFEVSANHSDTSTKLYWTDSAPPDIYRSNLDGTGVETVISGAGAAGLAIDVASGKLYWSESANGKIRRANLDGTGSEDVLSDLSEPESIAVDPTGGKIYWTDGSAFTISRADLDGSNIEEVVAVEAGYGLGDLVIDPVNLGLYWIIFTFEGESKLQRSSLDGSGMATLASTFVPQAYSAVSLDGYAERIYLAQIEACVPVPMCGGAFFGRVNVLDLSGAAIGSTAPAKLILSVAVDPIDSMIYFSHDDAHMFAPPLAGVIERQRTDGSDRETLASGLESPNNLAVAFDVSADLDDDGCTSDQELGGPAISGGERNPKDFWDFFDTPAPARDAQISGLDFFAVLARFGASGDNSIDPLSIPPPAPAYHTAFDRGMVTGVNPWNVAAADGAIAGTDFFTILTQFGHSCY
jgi:sugar lactone lactonase YvrE